MYLDKEKILTSLTEEDIKKICSHFGYPDYRHSGGGICFCTAMCHGGDSPYKLVFYPPNEQYNKWKTHCFTCGESYDIVELIIRASRNQGKTLTWYKALYTLAQLTGHIYETEIEESPSDLVDFKWLDRIHQLKNKKSYGIPNLASLNENILECFYYGSEPLQIWLNEGISKEAINRFEIGFYVSQNAITIPHRHWKTNDLIGVRGRFVREEDYLENGKYMPLFVEGQILKHSLGNNLYGAWVVKEKIKQCGKVLIVESEKSCMLSYTYFGEDSYTVATCGSSITRVQKRILLKEFRVSKVIYAPDRDYEESNSYAAEIWWNKQVKKVEDLLPFVDVYIIADKGHLLDYKNSPLDKGRDIFIELYKNKIKVEKEEK